MKGGNNIFINNTEVSRQQNSKDKKYVRFNTFHIELLLIIMALLPWSSIDGYHRVGLFLNIQIY
jgi:hypothetical protein